MARRSILAQIVARDTCVTFRRASLLEMGGHTPLFAPAQETGTNRSSVVGLNRPLSTITGLVSDSSVTQHLDSNVPIPCLEGHFLKRPSKQGMALWYLRLLSKENKNSPNEAQGGKYHEWSEVTTLDIKQISSENRSEHHR